MAADTADGTGGPLSVLVVEDEYFLADDLAIALHAAQARVVGPVATVGEAIALLDGPHPIDVAVLDIGLHGEIVFGVADLLAARRIPFVFISGYDPDIVPPRLARAAFWQKPCDVAALVRTLPALARDRG